MKRRGSPGERGRRVAVVAAGSLVFWASCDRRDSPRSMINRYPECSTYAVAPVLNFSGQFDLDPVRAADLLASELGEVQGISVLPVNRVVAYLAMQGKQQIESPAHAVQVARAIGADALLVGGITEYDPYTPIVGLALQIYTVSSSPPAAPVDAVAASREARLAGHTAAMPPGPSPAGQVQRVYNARHDDVVKAVKVYAKSRSQGENPFGWREYVTVQTSFLRFCWHDAVSRLLWQEAERRSASPAERAEEAP